MNEYIPLCLFPVRTHLFSSAGRFGAFICTGCGRAFDRTLPHTEPSVFMHSPYRVTEVCPYCGSDEISALETHCDHCGAGIYTCDDRYVREDGSVFCTECVRFKKARNF